MVIPIEESLIYVRPLYLRAQTGRIPELTRVIVAYQNRIVMEPTLDQAVARLFGQGPATSPRAGDQGHPAKTEATGTAPAAGGPTTSSPSWERVAADAREAYQRALEAQRAGDWAKYGEEIKRLGELLERLKQQK